MNGDELCENLLFRNASFLTNENTMEIITKANYPQTHPVFKMHFQSGKFEVILTQKILAHKNYSNNLYLNIWLLLIECGGHLRASKVWKNIFSHLQYEAGMKYDPNTDCHWIIRTKGKRKRILIQFETFRLESEPCYFDFLEIRDGENKNSPLIAKKCGGELRGKRFYSTTNAFRIRFKTDKNIHKKGFHMKYKIVKIGKILKKLKTTVNPMYNRRRDYFLFEIDDY